MVTQRAMHTVARPGTGAHELQRTPGRIAQGASRTAHREQSRPVSISAYTHPSAHAAALD